MTPARPSIVNKIAALHRAFTAAKLDHAFGGALALAWCTERARGTIDIDVNVFVDAERSSEVFDALPRAVAWTSADVAQCVRDGQVRIWWGETPIDIFTNTTPFHRSVGERAVAHEFAGARMPFLCCSDLAVFKAFFDRSRDWADLEDMAALDAFDVDLVLGALVHYLGADDSRVTRLQALVADRGIR